MVATHEQSVAELAEWPELCWNLRFGYPATPDSQDQHSDTRDGITSGSAQSVCQGTVYISYCELGDLDPQPEIETGKTSGRSGPPATRVWLAVPGLFSQSSVCTSPRLASSPRLFSLDLSGTRQPASKSLAAIARVCYPDSQLTDHDRG
ncbi:hypothetical protein ACMYSQ_006623 [Aspergillus niger]